MGTIYNRSYSWSGQVWTPNPLPYSSPKPGVYPAFPQFPPVGGMALAPIQSQAHSSHQPTPLPVIPLTQKNACILGAGVTGALGLLLLAVYHKLPAKLAFWHSAKVEKTPESKPKYIQLLPLKFQDDTAGIRQRQELSVEISNELWPKILAFAKDKPADWKKILSDEYNRILRTKLPISQDGVVNIEFKTYGPDYVGYPGSSSCLPLYTPLNRQCEKKSKPFDMGHLTYGPGITHFDPESIYERQRAFTTLSHETYHLLRLFAKTDEQANEMWPTDVINGVEGGPARVMRLIQKERSQNPACGLPDPLGAEGQNMIREGPLSPEQVTAYWNFLKKQWSKPGCEDIKGDKYSYPYFYERVFQKHTREQLQKGIEDRYLNELEAHSIARYRAPGISPEQVTQEDVKDLSTAFGLRQIIRAYYEYYRVPPEQQSDLVKDIKTWPLELKKNPLD